MRYYPIFLDVRGRRAVVVGGGKVAERKVRKLLRAGARVHVVSPDLTPGLARLAEQKKIAVTRRRYRKGDVAVGAHRDAPFLVFAATSDTAVQCVARRDAAAAGALVNLANSAEDSDFIVPASFTRGDLHVAISTSGRNPTLARTLRLWLEAEVKKGKWQRSNGKWQMEKPG